MSDTVASDRARDCVTKRTLDKTAAKRSSASNDARGARLQSLALSLDRARSAARERRAPNEPGGVLAQRRPDNFTPKRTPGAPETPPARCGAQAA
ncbi:hypothetical protein, partial [Burkholderia thailandensis]|uniref:hypothetical protein n=1 Tax=Burkholderia thailandensis TaxID=57975 RepID=UPI001E4BBC7B